MASHRHGRRGAAGLSDVRIDWALETAAARHARDVPKGWGRECASRTGSSDLEGIGDSATNHATGLMGSQAEAVAPDIPSIDALSQRHGLDVVAHRVKMHRPVFGGDFLDAPQPKE